MEVQQYHLRLQKKSQQPAEPWQVLVLVIAWGLLVPPGGLDCFSLYS
jgi:hypothetical protein